MDNFEAFLRGARGEYLGSHLGLNPDDYGIPEENHQAFLLGAEISCDRFMIISCDSSKEFERDINSYNLTAASVDAFFGQKVVAPYQHGADPNEFTAVNPDTGERIPLFKN